MTERSLATIMAKTGKSRDEAVAVLASMSPGGRLIRPQEVSAAALQLCAEGSQHVTGRAISINAET